MGNIGRQLALVGAGPDLRKAASPPADASPALSFSMNTNSSRRRVIRTEERALCEDQDLEPHSRLAFLPTGEELTRRGFYRGIMSGASTAAPLILTAPELLSAGASLRHSRQL